MAEPGRHPGPGHREPKVAAGPVDPPALVVVYTLEQPARVELHAHTLEDEQRLRLWLQRAPLADQTIRGLAWPVASGMAA